MTTLSPAIRTRHPRLRSGRRAGGGPRGRTGRAGRGRARGGPGSRRRRRPRRRGPARVSRGRMRDRDQRPDPSRAARAPAAAAARVAGEGAGVPDEEILFVIATGTHAPMSAAQFGEVVPPEILARFRVISHDARDEAGLVRRGETPRGTPVWVNRDVCGVRTAGGGRRDRAAPVRGLLGRREERRHRPRRVCDHQAQPLDDVAAARRDRPVQRQPVPAGHRGHRRAHRHSPGAQRHPRRQQADHPGAGRPAGRRDAPGDPAGAPDQSGRGGRALRPDDRVAGRASEGRQPLPGPEGARACGAGDQARRHGAAGGGLSGRHGQRGVRARGWRIRR